MEKGREAAGTERIFEETGSGDMWYDVLDDVAYALDVQEDLTTRGIVLIHRSGTAEEKRILPFPNLLGFRIQKRTRKIYYALSQSNNIHQLWQSDLDGKNGQLIAGGGNESVLHFCVTDRWLFVLIKDIRSDAFKLYRMSPDFRDVSIISNCEKLHRSLVADEQHLYYVTRDDITHTSLIEYDIDTQRERVLLRDEMIQHEWRFLHTPEMYYAVYSDHPDPERAALAALRQARRQMERQFRYEMA